MARTVAGEEPEAQTLITVVEGAAVETAVAVATVVEVVATPMVAVEAMVDVVAMKVTATKHQEVSTCPLLERAPAQEVEAAYKARIDSRI